MGLALVLGCQPKTDASILRFGPYETESQARDYCLVYAADHGLIIGPTAGTSMLPVFPTRSWIALDTKPYKSLVVGEVIRYWGRLDETSNEKTLLVHEIVGIDKDGLIMSGINNSHTEIWDRVKPEEYAGRVVAIFSWKQ